jgi:hypothetical protein
MPKDMQLLRDLWQRIAPDCALGAKDGESHRQLAVNRILYERRIAADTQSMQARVDRLRASGILHKPKRGEMAFCRSHGISFT